MGALLRRPDRLVKLASISSEMVVPACKESIIGPCERPRHASRGLGRCMPSEAARALVLCFPKRSAGGRAGQIRKRKATTDQKCFRVRDEENAAPNQVELGTVTPTQCTWWRSLPSPAKEEGRSRVFLRVSMVPTSRLPGYSGGDDKGVTLQTKGL